MRVEARGTLPHPATSCNTLQHSLQHSLQHTHEVWDSRVTDRTVFGSCILTALRAGEFSQKSALKKFYIVNWLASWLLRIFTSKHIVPRPSHVETDVCVCVWVCVSNVCLYACMHSRMYVNICARMCEGVYMEKRLEITRCKVCMYVCTCVCMYVKSECVWLM